LNLEVLYPDLLHSEGSKYVLIKLSGKQGGPTAVPDPERLGDWYHMVEIFLK
jgi:hypothetical protein